MGAGGVGVEGGMGGVTLPTSIGFSVRFNWSHLNGERRQYPILDTRISVRPDFSVRHAHATPPPWILKRGGLESFGLRLISSNGQNTHIRAYKPQLFVSLRFNKINN